MAAVWASVASGAAINIGLPFMPLLTKPPNFVVALGHVKRWRFVVTLVPFVGKFWVFSNQIEIRCCFAQPIATI